MNTIMSKNMIENKIRYFVFQDRKNIGCKYMKFLRAMREMPNYFIFYRKINLYPTQPLSFALPIFHSFLFAGIM